ncbi:amidohydrolase family protein [Nocardioides carbamazepini]|uniref:amidohydrolase family protein n=1 Tax=Nocardioides carbamazepini TaxID=2854259 RepID=UPI00214A8032|nr:amidohydrolase family protein [Nocardioides carbamazepini]MCR1786134.1 amidohydrolase family protein [Nocardioides carbamazepini]
MTGGPTPAPALIEGAFVCTADAEHRVLPHASVLVVDGRIAALGSAGDVAPAVAALPDEQRGRLARVDARGAMVLPGFVNPHFHDVFVDRARQLLADGGYGDPQPGVFSQGGHVTVLSQVFDGLRGLVDHLRPDEAEAIARYSLWTQLRCGITTVGEVGSLNRPEATTGALRFLGMRGAVNGWISDGYCDPATGAFQRTRSVADIVAELDEVATACAAQPGDQVRFLASAIYSLNMSDELGAAMADLVRRHDARFATHVAAMANESAASVAAFGRSSVRRFHDLGLLDDRLLAVHCAFTDADEERLVREHGVHVCMAPAKYGTTGENTMSGNGGQFLRFKRAGVNLSVSTDGEAAAVAGQIEAMRMAWLPQNELAADDTAVLPTEALAMGTRNAAAGLGWDAEIGSLEVGKQADLVLAPIDDWRYLMVSRPLDAFLQMASYTDVRSVMVGGQWVIRDGRTLAADERDLEAAAVEATLAVVGRIDGNAAELRAAYDRRYGHRARD